MIKGITLVHPIASTEAFTQLSTLLLSLGFEAGKGWQDATGQGAAFLAPLGNLELVMGRLPGVYTNGQITPSLLIETTQLDHLHTAIHQHLLKFQPDKDPATLLTHPRTDGLELPPLHRQT